MPQKPDGPASEVKNKGEQKRERPPTWEEVYPEQNSREIKKKGRTMAVSRESGVRRQAQIQENYSGVHQSQRKTRTKLQGEKWSSSSVPGKKDKNRTTFNYKNRELKKDFP